MDDYNMPDDKRQPYCSERIGDIRCALLEGHDGDHYCDDKEWNDRDSEWWSAGIERGLAVDVKEVLSQLRAQQQAAQRTVDLLIKAELRIKELESELKNLQTLVNKGE